MQKQVQLQCSPFVSSSGGGGNIEGVDILSISNVTNTSSSTSITLYQNLSSSFEKKYKGILSLCVYTLNSYSSNVPSNIEISKTKGDMEKITSEFKTISSFAYIGYALFGEADVGDVYNGSIKITLKSASSANKVITHMLIGLY